MRLATWNLNRATWQHRKRFDTAAAHARAAWDQLSTLKVDLALLQEAMPHPTGLLRPPSSVLPADPDRESWRSRPGPARWWCSAIASWGDELEALSNDERAEPLYVSQQGAYAVGLLNRLSKPLVLASVYALWDYGWLPKGSKPRYAHTSLHRAISDLTPVLDADYHGMSVVLAGDFNTSSQFESPHREAFRTVHDRLAGLGLTNVAIRPDGQVLDRCPCDDTVCRHIQTIEGPVPYQDDYVYMSGDIAAAARVVSVERTEPVQAISDHFPVVIETDA